jgi:hypothetical protein
MNYTRENPPPGAMWFCHLNRLFYRWVVTGAEVADESGDWMASSRWARHEFDELPVFEPVACRGDAANARMLERDGQPPPTPTPAAPYLVQAPMSGDGLLTLAVFGKRNVWGA